MRPELLINIVCPALIISFGSIGNGLALWTLFFSKVLRKRVISIFLIVLFLADSSSILSGYGFQWMINVLQVNVTNHVSFVNISSVEDADKGLQILKCRPWEPFVLVFIYHYISFTVSAFTMAALTIERCLVVFCPYMNFSLKEQRAFMKAIVLFIVLISFIIYFPMACIESELYWNPLTGNLDLNGTYPTWSLSVAMLTAFVIVFPANIALLVKMSKENQFRQVFKESKKSFKTTTTSMDNEDSATPGCLPLTKMIDIKMTFILIGISLAFIVLTIPHRFLVIHATLNNITIAELPVAITRQTCHINFACNSLFYFFIASECREELRKTCSLCKN